MQPSKGARHPPEPLDDLKAPAGSFDDLEIDLIVIGPPCFEGLARIHPHLLKGLLAGGRAIFHHFFQAISILPVGG